MRSYDPMEQPPFSMKPLRRDPREEAELQRLEAILDALPRPENPEPFQMEVEPSTEASGEQLAQPHFRRAFLALGHYR